MVEIDSTKPLNVRRIDLTDGTVLYDKTVFIAGGFLIVGANREDTAPTWYNLQTVERLEQVTIDKGSGRPQNIIRFF